MLRSISLAVAVVLALTAGAAAKFDDAKFAAARKAADAFAALAKGSETSGTAPRQSDVKVKALIDAVFDASILGSETLSINDSGKVGDLLNNGNRVGFVYLLAGTGATGIDKIGEDPKAMERIGKNTSAFAPEIGVWFDFQIRIQNSLADSTLGWLATVSKADLEKPNVKSGLGQVRAGLARSISGLLQTMADENLDDPWRRARMPTLQLLTPKAAKLVTAEDAKALQDLAAELSGLMKDDAVKAELARFGAAIMAGQPK